MKRVFILISIILGIVACENQPISFEDYDYKSVYFPIQLPLRTLSLGEDRVDNSLDRQYAFDMAVGIGGMYENKKSWTVDFALDPTLLDSVYHNTTNLKILQLPSSYYTMTPTGTATIPKGEFTGRIRVQLTSSFFDDTLAITGQYVVPLKITDTSADTILEGKAAISNADRRVKSNWESNKSPKNWVMYGIKYVNAYHGTYLHRGRDIQVTTATGVPFDTTVWRNPFGYIEKDPLIKLFTIGRNKAISNGVGPLVGTNSMTLTFANDKGDPGAVTITPRDGSPISVTGSGQYFNKATSQEKWTLLTWQSMYLTYTYDDGTLTHNITDTLVFRDRGIKWEENVIKIIAPAP